jgi:hypothetical protein
MNERNYYKKNEEQRNKKYSNKEGENFNIRQKIISSFH